MYQQPLQTSLAEEDGGIQLVGKTSTLLRADIRGFRALKSRIINFKMQGRSSIECRISGSTVAFLEDGGTAVMEALSQTLAKAAVRDQDRRVLEQDNPDNWLAVTGRGPQYCLNLGIILPRLPAIVNAGIIAQLGLERAWISAPSQSRC
jgi:hypothetical protein